MVNHWGYECVECNECKECKSVKILDDSTVAMINYFIIKIKNK